MGESITVKAWFVNRDIKQYEIAKALNISVQSVNNKMNKRSDFTLDQVRTLHEIYGVPADIFLV